MSNYLKLKMAETLEAFASTTPEERKEVIAYMRHETIRHDAAKRYEIGETFSNIADALSDLWQVRED